MFSDNATRFLNKCLIFFDVSKYYSVLQRYFFCNSIAFSENINFKFGWILVWIGISLNSKRNNLADEFGFFWAFLTRFFLIMFYSPNDIEMHWKSDQPLISCSNKKDSLQGRRKLKYIGGDKVRWGWGGIMFSTLLLKYVKLICQILVGTSTHVPIRSGAPAV